MRTLEKSAHELVALLLEEEIFYDIDMRLDLIDFVRSISVMCSETFIHPDMAIIAKKFSEQKILVLYLSPPTDYNPYRQSSWLALRKSVWSL